MTEQNKRHDSLVRLLQASKLAGPSALAAALNESEQVVTNWGRRGVSKQGAIKAQRVFGCDVDYILEGKDGSVMLVELKTTPAKKAIELDGNADFPAIRRVSLKAQAGVTGYSVDYLNDDGPPIVFRKDWYTAHNYNPEKMLALRVAGESMIPSLYAGDLIVINSAQTEPKDGIAFVVAYEGEINVKRLVRDDGLWWLASDNQDQRRYPRKKCNQDTEIIGEVVYRQTERI